MTGRRTPMIAGIASGVVVLVAVMFFVLPKMRAVGTAEDELHAAEQDAQSLQAQLGSLQQAQEGAPETERKIAAIDDQIPPVVDLPVLIQQLQAASDRAAVDFFSFSPGTPTPDPTGQYSVLASQITVTGGYFSVDEFLFLLETLPRAAKVTQIAVSPTAAAGEATGTEIVPSASSSTLQLAATVEFYTTDTSAGPGSEPGPIGGATGATGAISATGAVGLTGATGSTRP